MPSLHESGGYAFLLFCAIALATSAFLVVNPIRFFTILSLGRRPLPNFIRKRWVILAYRIIAAGIFVQAVGLLLQLLRR